MRIESYIRVVVFCLALWAIPGGAAFAEDASQGSPSPSLIQNANVLVALLIFTALFLFFLAASRRGRALYLRKIPGVAAIEEAIGRATEMGRPVLYIPGIDKIDEIQTVASMAVLGHVARSVGEYGAELIVPVRDSIVMSVCEETVREGFTAAGRPDSYKPDNVRYLSDEQFAYTAGVDGIMLRERPAANIYLGSFYAESLILAETGFASGALQVAGTAQIPQLPFFVAACDYTIIAEEFFAVSAYLSRDPRSVSSIKASDYFKIVLILALVSGVVAATLFGADCGAVRWLKEWF